MLKGDNVQSLTINNESAATKNAALTSAADAVAANGAARVITIEEADIKVGRTIQVQIAMSSATTAKDATVSHTIATGDTGVKIAQALADKLKAHATATAYDAASAAGVKAAASGNDGTITLAAALGVVMDNPRLLEWCESRPAFSSSASIRSHPM